MDNEQRLLNYCVQNHQYFKNVLLKPLKDDAGTLLEDDRFNYEWIDRAKWIIVTNICVNLLISSDVALEFVQNLNIVEMLK